MQQRFESDALHRDGAAINAVSNLSHNVKKLRRLALNSGKQAKQKA
jgi:hypothetical protein